MNENLITLALETGTSKMAALMGEIVDGGVNVLSLGRSTSIGVRKGDIADPSRAAGLAQAAIANAEKRISASGAASVYMSLSGSHIRGLRSVGSANVSGADGVVRREDVERAKNDAKSKSIPDGRLFINTFCCGYYLDGEPCDDPVGKAGNLLEAEYWLLHGDGEKILTQISIVESFGMDVAELVHSGVASALASTTQQRRKKGVLVVDMGSGTTDYALYRNGRAVQVGTIPVGGDHVTNDISLGLHVSIKNANKLNLKYGKIILTEEERRCEIWLNGDKSIGDNVFVYGSLNKIICARFEEIFTILRKELARYFADSQVPAVVLTGGLSKTRGIEAVAEAVLGVPCEPAVFPEWVKPALCHPEYATALGLLARASEDAAKAPVKSRGFLTGITKMFARRRQNGVS